MQNSHARANSVTAPLGVMRPIVAGRNSELSVNQRFPSDPLAMYLGALSAVGRRYCFSAPTGAAWAGPASSTESPIVSRARRRTGI